MNRSTAYANANIALIKYWGKFEASLNVPAALSLSMTLSHLGTKVTVTSIDGPSHQASIINGAIKEKDLLRLKNYLELVRQYFPFDGFLKVVSESSIGISAGLASSASFFAALATALNAHFKWQLDQQQLSILARMGSASAARSIFGGFAALKGGVSHEEAYAYPVSSKLDLAMVLAVVDQSPKPISSREAMNITQATSPFYRAFIESQKDDFDRAVKALSEGDITILGELMEHSTLKMFASMWTAIPAINYWHPKSLELISMVYQLRKEQGEVYFTMDAGPNVKILCPELKLPAVLTRLACSGLTTDIRTSAPGEGSKILSEHLHD